VTTASWNTPSSTITTIAVIIVIIMTG
jgi:hypothetical protein